MADAYGGDPVYAALSNEDDPRTMLGKILSPASAESLIGPPPDAPPPSSPGVSTVRTGNLAAAPKQAIAKNLDTAEGQSAYSLHPTLQAAQATKPIGGLARPSLASGASTLAPLQASRMASYNASPAGQAALAPAPAMASGVGSGTSIGGLAPAMTNGAKVVPDRLNMQTLNDQQKLAALTNSGSGVSQIKNPFLRSLARVGDVAGSILAPGVAQAIPGTTLHHQQLLGQQQGIVANDQSQQTARANQEDITQQAAQRAGKAAQDLADAGRDALRKPTAKEAELYNLDPDASYRPTELGRLAIEANKGSKPDSVQGMYAAAVKDALDRGVDPSKDPKVQQLADAQTSIQKQPASKAEQRDDRAIEILSKPPAQRTPGENAYMTGYNQWVKETKTDPGMARMSVLLQQPIAVADPDTPGGEKFVSKKNAIGMGAPGGVDTTAPKALVKDFTSGTDAKTLTNINTADAHIQQLGKIAQTLQNGDIQGLNRLANAWKEQTGDAAPMNFQLLKTALAAEIAKTTTGGAATVEETKEISKAINAANSPAQLAGVTKEASALMHSKRQNLQNQFDAGIKGKPNFNSSGPARDPNMLYARDPSGKLHSAPKAGAKPLPPGWKYDTGGK